MNADLREVELEPSTFASRFASPPVDLRMRVLQLGPALAVRGGISSVERLICEYMKPYAAIRHVPTMEDGSAVTRGLTYARAVQVLWRALADIDPVIVHIHFASRGSTLRKVVLADMVARAGRPLVLHAHGARFDQFHRRLPAPLRRKVNRTLQRANLVIALSSQWREFFVEECELAPAKVTVLPNPVRWNAAPPDRSGRPHVQFLSLGRLSERKGSYDLVNAFAALPRELRARARLVLAGDGDVEGVRQLAAPLGDAVRVHAWIDPAERDRLLDASDVFVLPSRAEGLPMALLEAMSAGLPAIVTPVGGIPDALTDGAEGLMVEPGRVDQITAAMTRMLGDEADRLAAGRRAHARARLFDVNTYARRLADLYQRIAPVAGFREYA
ncbi:MAG TPA: glycosyltransferase family 4 protein [Steroidobacteraceae bacterium]|jgi:glycosyltransferase involved in cell wall biosynthesis|nr:glycosyltransferase family 4 protein [Steroidobacteraceae bacterium]